MPAGRLRFLNQTATAYAGEVQLVFWYDENDVVIGKEYRIKTRSADTFASVARTQAQHGDCQPSRYEHPVIVLGRGMDGEYTLVIERYPFDGQDAVHYELYLLDADGKRVNLKPGCRLYFPYPEGVGTEEAFTICHYNTEGEVVEAFGEDKIQRSADGPTWLAAGEDGVIRGPKPHICRNSPKPHICHMFLLYFFS